MECGTPISNQIKNIVVTYADGSVQDTRMNDAVFCDDCAHEQCLSSFRPEHRDARRITVEVDAMTYQDETVDLNQVDEMHKELIQRINDGFTPIEANEEFWQNIRDREAKGE